MGVHKPFYIVNAILISTLKSRPLLPFLILQLKSWAGEILTCLKCPCRPAQVMGTCSAMLYVICCLISPKQHHLQYFCLLHSARKKERRKLSICAFVLLPSTADVPCRLLSNFVVWLMFLLKKSVHRRFSNFLETQDFYCIKAVHFSCLSMWSYTVHVRSPQHLFKSIQSLKLVNLPFEYICKGSVCYMPVICIFTWKEEPLCSVRPSWCHLCSMGAAAMWDL